MFSPIYSGGRIVCFAGGAFVHSSDVGGLCLPAVSPRRRSDRFQEGVVSSAREAVQSGKARLRRCRGSSWPNCRIPEQNWGDISALTAALTNGPDVANG